MDELTHDALREAHEALRNRGRARLDALVAQQDERIRQAVELILELPNIRLEEVYDMITRNPEVFVLFLERQLVFAGADVQAVDCPAPIYTEPDSLERDFYGLRSAIDVLLHYNNLKTNEAGFRIHREYDFLVAVPPGSDDGYVEATSVDQLFGHPGTFLNPGTNRAPRHGADLIPIIRLAIPSAEVMRDTGLMRRWPEDFFNFANEFLQAAEDARPGSFGAFAANGDTARSFILCMFDLFTGGSSRPRISADGNTETYQAIRRRIVLLMPRIGDLYDQANLYTLAIARFRSAATRGDWRRAMPDLDAQRLDDAFRAGIPWALNWNHEAFRAWLDPMVPWDQPALNQDIRRDMADMLALEDELNTIDDYNQGRTVRVPRADFVDVETAAATKRSYDALPDDLPEGGVPESSASSDDSQGGDRCTFCTKVLGEPRPKREPGYKMSCGHSNGIDCLRLWFTDPREPDEDRDWFPTCPLCRARVTPPPSPSSGSPSPHLESPPPRNSESPAAEQPTSGDSDRNSRRSSNPLSRRSSISMSSSDARLFDPISDPIRSPSLFNEDPGVFPPYISPEPMQPESPPYVPVARPGTPHYSFDSPEGSESPPSERPARPGTPHYLHSSGSSDAALSDPVAPEDNDPVAPENNDPMWTEDAATILDNRHQWFERVFIPAAALSYFGRTQEDPDAFREWLRTEIRPLVQQVLLQDPANIALTRIVNM